MPKSKKKHSSFSETHSSDSEYSSLKAKRKRASHDEHSKQIKLIKDANKLIAELTDASSDNSDEPGDRDDEGRTKWGSEKKRKSKKHRKEKKHKKLKKSRNVSPGDRDGKRNTKSAMSGHSTPPKQTPTDGNELMKRTYRLEESICAAAAGTSPRDRDTSAERTHIRQAERFPKQVASRWDSSGEGEHSQHGRNLAKHGSKLYGRYPMNQYAPSTKSRDSYRRTTPVARSVSPPPPTGYGPGEGKERTHDPSEHQSGHKKYSSHTANISRLEHHRHGSKSEGRSRYPDDSPKHHHNPSKHYNPPARGAHYNDYTKHRSSRRRGDEEDMTRANDGARMHDSNSGRVEHNRKRPTTPGDDREDRSQRFYGRYGSNRLPGRDSPDRHGREKVAKPSDTRRETTAHGRNRHERHGSEAETMNYSPNGSNSRCLRSRSRSPNRQLPEMKKPIEKFHPTDRKPGNSSNTKHPRNQQHDRDNEWGARPKVDHHGTNVRPAPKDDHVRHGERMDAEPDDESTVVPKEKPDFGLSGKLTEETNKVNGVVITYAEPAGARKPKRRWRLYPFKGEQALPTLYIHRQSCYLIGRERKVCDLPVDHPSCSKQHAVLQYRLVPYERNDGTSGQRVRPYLIDLGSANGTFLNNKPIDPMRFHELHEKDVLKFGFSSREYVLLHENSKEDNEDDEGYDVSPVSRTVPPASISPLASAGQRKDGK